MQVSRHLETGNTSLFWCQVDDDDEEVPLMCMLHVSGDAKHSGDTVFPLNRHWKLLKL